MSLINDALKRAQKAQGVRPAVPSREPILQPVVAATARPILGINLLAAAAILLAVVAFSLSAMAWRRSEQLHPAPRPSALSVSAKSATRIPPAAIVPRVAAATTVGPLAKAVPKSRPEPKPSASSNLSSAPAAPVLQLQAIHYRLTNPSACINGKTAGVGGQVDGARITAIERESVQVEVQGRLIILKRAPSRDPVRQAAR